jgi:hypothetical protein
VYIYGTRGDRKIKVQTDREKAKVTRWGQDIMRPSFASYHYAMWEDAGKTAAQMGHTSSQLIFKHYHKKVTKAEAEQFWNIGTSSRKRTALPTSKVKPGETFFVWNIGLISSYKIYKNKGG